MQGNGQARSIIRKYLILIGLENFAYSQTFALYALFLTNVGKMNKLEINLINLFFFATLCVMEVPTGAFADVFGRKKSYLCALALGGIGTFVYGCSSTFWGFVAAEITVGIAKTFANGAFESWVIAALKECGDCSSFRKIIAPWQFSTRTVGMALGSITGAWIGNEDMRHAFYAETVLVFSVGVLAFFLIMENSHYDTEKKSLGAIWEKARDGVKAARGNSTILFILVAALVMCASFKAPDMFWTLRYESAYSKAQISWMGTAIALLAGLGSLLAMLTEKWSGKNARKEKQVMLACQTAVALCFIGGALCVGALPSFLFMLFHEMPRALWRTLKSAYVHDSIKNDSLRATVSSAAFVADHIGGMLGLIFAGVCGEWLGINPSWLISGIALAIATVFLWQRNGNGHRAEAKE